MQLLVMMVGLLALSGQESGKLDPGLENVSEATPVFVRMDSQLFKKAGDFERFCEKHEKSHRSATRKEVLATLHGNADRSWAQIKQAVSDLESKGAVKNVQRFWILNGFACDATAAGCKALAGRPNVSFVYRQTGPSGLHQNPTPSPRADDGAKIAAMKAALKVAKDDSKEPFTTAGVEVPWDLKQIQADLVWEREGVTGKGVVVAVNDAGIYAVPALQSALWRNPKETLDGKDDDGNGYVDDVFGWDARGQSGQVLGNQGVFHGTMCSGIIAGRPTREKKLVTGVAPRSRLMLVNGSGYLAGFEYALENGADVFSMSYMFVKMELGNYRGVYRLAAEDMTAGGVLLCGGAGNFAKSEPEGKQITVPKDIPCVMAAAGTQEDGTRPEFSSKGPVSWAGVKFYDDYPASKPLIKPDVSAPAAGFTCWSIAEDVRPPWKAVFTGSEGDVLVAGPRGNSFAGPHVAGVAALIFSARPEIQPWQVKRIIEETCKDMGPKGRDVLHGEGLVQALAAVRRAKALRTSGSG